MVRTEVLVGAGIQVADHLPPAAVQRRDDRAGVVEQVDVVHRGRHGLIQAAGELPLPGGMRRRAPDVSGGVGGRRDRCRARVAAGYQRRAAQRQCQRERQDGDQNSQTKVRHSDQGTLLELNGGRAE